MKFETTFRGAKGEVRVEPRHSSKDAVFIGITDLFSDASASLFVPLDDARKIAAALVEVADSLSTYKPSVGDLVLVGHYGYTGEDSHEGQVAQVVREVGGRYGGEQWEVRIVSGPDADALVYLFPKEMTPIGRAFSS